MGLKKEEPMHYFEVDKEKVEASVFEGRLIKISPDSYEYEGTLRQTIKMLFTDGHEHYQLDSSYNMLTRSLINSLLGYIDQEKKEGKEKGRLELELSLYVSKTGHKQLGIKINGERANWRYDIETQKTMVETITKKNGTKENDYFELDEKLKSCIPEIQSFIEVTDFVEEPKQSTKEELSIDDIPF